MVDNSFKFNMKNRPSINKQIEEMALREGVTTKNFSIGSSSYEYSVSDYSAVDKLIDELAKRETLITKRLLIENIKKYFINALIIIGGICALMLFSAISYRIAFPTGAYQTVKDTDKKVRYPKKSVKEIIKEVKTETKKNNSSDLTNTIVLTEGDLINKNYLSYKKTKGKLITNKILYGNKLNVSLLWNNFNDLDLYIKCPNGEIINYKNINSKNGGQLHADGNVFYKVNTRSPIENVSWNDKVPNGKYEIILNLNKHDSNDLYLQNKYQIIIDKNNGNEIREIRGIYGEIKGINKKVGKIFIKNKT
jgi:hypothetical protein